MTDGAQLEPWALEMLLAWHAADPVSLKERERIRNAFGRYVDDEIAKEVMSSPDFLAPGGTLQQVTILMSDLRGFTGLTARLGPERMVELLNDYLDRMTQVVAAEFSEAESLFRHAEPAPYRQVDVVGGVGEFDRVVTAALAGFADWLAVPAEESALLDAQFRAFAGEPFRKDYPVDF